VRRHSAAALRDVASIWLSHRPGRAAGPAPATPAPAPAPVLEPPGEALPAGVTPA
jgi:hypothetical protein